MPRQARLDAPGVLQHVMARGIERSKIFCDDKDRSSFLERLAVILEETQTQCYAWALIPNHFHLLLRTGPTPLSTVMRRLMTGYAVTFNIRHRRSGHLFQNRYKSVVCEEDPYLQELIRYIHLNPLRAKLVKDLKELDKYLWTGHSALLGKRKNPLIPKQADQPNRKSVIPNPKSEMSLAERTIQDVLRYFGESFKVARRRYRQFVKNGIDQGKCPEFQGGGLVRSAGGEKAGLLGRRKEEREKGDQRILGSGDFVGDVLRKAGEQLESMTKKRMSLDEIIAIVANSTETSIEDLKSTGRKRKLAHARAVIAYVAIRNLGYMGIEVAEALSLSPSTVSQNVEKGKIFLDRDEDLKVILQIN
ncbi:hypothetical protein BuS5_02343 [Desulfosarcina sp. BuS5]|nr:hypothetical protein BuS5_02343 [Desulfosarcina sp. BuS5]